MKVTNARFLGYASVVLTLTALISFLLLARWETHPPAPMATAASEQAIDLQPVQAAAEKGQADAQNILGEIHAAGKQIPQNYPEAAKWYRKAAEQGFAKAQYNLAVLLEAGQGLPLDEAEAAAWYRKAAEHGLADAQYNLAAMYGLGRGVPLSHSEALKWYHRAAEQGDSLAQYNLAERYERGKGVTPDLVEAYKWYGLAAAGGFSDAKSAKDRLKSKLTSAQRDEAQKRIDEFRQRFPASIKSKTN